MSFDRCHLSKLVAGGPDVCQRRRANRFTTPTEKVVLYGNIRTLRASGDNLLGFVWRAVPPPAGANGHHKPSSTCAMPLRCESLTH